MAPNALIPNREFESKNERPSLALNVSISNKIARLAILENQIGHFRLFWRKVARLAILENQIGHFRLFWRKEARLAILENQIGHFRLF